MTKFKTLWFWDSEREAGSSFNFVMSFFDDSHEKPSIVRGIKSPHHSYCHSFNTVDNESRQVIHLVSDDFVGSCPLWYVFVDAQDSVPAVRMLFAYADERYPNGTVVPFDEAVASGVSPNDAAGLFRWFTSDSRIQQIFVHEAHRRKRVAVKMISVADIFIVSDRNWNGVFLNGGDITTDSGETLRYAFSDSSRVTPRLGSVS